MGAKILWYTHKCLNADSQHRKEIMIPSWKRFNDCRLESKTHRAEPTQTPNRWTRIRVYDGSTRCYQCTLNPYWRNAFKIYALWWERRISELINFSFNASKQGEIFTLYLMHPANKRIYSYATTTDWWVDAKLEFQYADTKGLCQQDPDLFNIELSFIRVYPDEIHKWEINWSRGKEINQYGYSGFFLVRHLCFNARGLAKGRRFNSLPDCENYFRQQKRKYLPQSVSIRGRDSDNRSDTDLTISPLCIS